LDACGLLEINGQILRTSIPVLGPEELQKIRQKLKQEAYKLGPIITPEIQNLVKLLNSQGYSDNTYSIVFSYLLDGMVWNHFEKQNLMPVYKITPERPFWDGTFYAVYPARIDRPGTNTNSSG
jgi:hypothetical protein